MDIAIRAVVLFTAVYVVLRAVGRRELAQLEPFDLILLIVLGDAIQQGLTQDDYSVTGSLIAISTIAALQAGLGFMAYKSKGFRRALEGEPIVLLENGEPIEKNLRRVRIATEELAEIARQQQVPSLNDVAWAVLETSGRISIIPKYRVS